MSVAVRLTYCIKISMFWSSCVCSLIKTNCKYVGILNLLVNGE